MSTGDKILCIAAFLLFGAILFVHLFDLKRYKDKIVELTDENLKHTHQAEAYELKLLFREERDVLVQRVDSSTYWSMIKIYRQSKLDSLHNQEVLLLLKKQQAEADSITYYK